MSESSGKRRMGRFTVSELTFLQQNAEKLSVEQIAQKLNRDPLSIHKWLTTNVGLNKEQKKEIEGSNELKRRTYYKELQKQFNEEELDLFEFHFKKMWVQFKDDVFHTEEMQIIDAIKYEILMNRILCAQQSSKSQIEELENDIALEKRIGDKDLQDRDYILNLERQVASIRSSQEMMGKEFKEYQSRKAALIKELKGTRDQRIKSVEDSKVSFATLVKKLTVDPQFRYSVGIEMETMRHATEAERLRLSKAVTFRDGVVDRPLLNSESVQMEE